MKKLKRILIAIMLLVSVPFLYVAYCIVYPHQVFVFNHLLVGLPEGFLLLNIIFGLNISIDIISDIIHKGEIHELGSHADGVISTEKNERAKIQQAFESERKAYTKLNDELMSIKQQHETLKSVNQALSVTINNLEIDNATFQTAMAEQAKAIQSKDHKIEELLLKKKPKIFKPRKSTSKTKTK